MKEYFKYWKEFIIVVLSIICIILLMTSSCSGHKNKVLNNNIKALRDTVTQVQLKNGEILSEKQSLILSNKELSDYLDLSKQEIKDLQKKLDSKVLYITELESSIRIDTITCVDSIYIRDSIRYTDFRYTDEWIHLYGTTNLSKPQTTINELFINTPLTVGLTEDSQFFITTPNPYIKITNINSVIVDNKKTTKPKRWNVGLNLGLGVQYDLIKKEFGVGPYLGIGVSYGFSF